MIPGSNRRPSERAVPIALQVQRLMTAFVQFLDALKTVFMEHPLFLIGLLLIIGYFLGKLFGRLGLPDIAGFIFAGLMVNAFTTGLVSQDLNASLHVVTEVAIGLLAISVGAEFSIRKMRRIGRHIFVVTLTGLAVTFGVVFLACIGLNRLVPSLPIGYPYAILLAVIACATAPAVIVAEVHHLRAHGTFVDYLFGVVALGDAICVVMFGLAFTVVTNILDVESAFAFSLEASLRDIGLSLAAGAIGGVILHVLAHRIRNPNEHLIVTLGIVFMTTGFAIVLHLSPLLLNMMLGAVLVNMSARNHRLFRQLDPLTPPIYALFFVIAGIELNPGIFMQRVVVLAGAFYLFSRAFGRYLGTYAGSFLCQLDRPIRRNLGLCMFAQGGIALGFVLLIQTSPMALPDPFQDAGFNVFTVLSNIVLASIFVNELISPFFLKAAILRGNEMET